MQRKKVGEVLWLSMDNSVRNVERAHGKQYAPGVREELAALLGIAEGYERELGSRRADADLSDAGRLKAVERAALGTLQKVSEFEEKTVGKLRRAAAMVEQALFQKAAPQRPTDAAERIAYEMRQREIRDELRRLDATQRLTVYLTSTDAEVLDAIESAPPALVKLGHDAASVFRPFVDPEKRAVAMVERARAKDPERAAQLDAFNSMAEVYALAVGGIRGEILAEVPSARPESIRVVKAE